ncbi:hypothetical protein FACS1894105_11540 [Clostridia bacterium]|nr:hypothetical protein FACS1894105_11540 [Clostridia bacterium]
MSKKQQELQTANSGQTVMLPGVQELSYAEKKLNKKTGAVVETAKAFNGAVAQNKSTKTGGQITTVIKPTTFTDKKERDKSIVDHAKNGVNQKLNALAHDVSQPTISTVVKKNKK